MKKIPAVLASVALLALFCIVTVPPATAASVHSIVTAHVAHAQSPAMVSHTQTGVVAQATTSMTVRSFHSVLPNGDGYRYIPGVVPAVYTVINPTHLNYARGFGLAPHRLRC